MDEKEKKVGDYYLVFSTLLSVPLLDTYLYIYPIAKSPITEYKLEQIRERGPSDSKD